MNIHFDPNSLHQSKSGMITGIAYIEAQPGSFFPCEMWNDFVVVLANWWLDAALELTSEQSKVRMRFMDGPYWMDVISNNERVCVACIDDHTLRSQPAEFEYDLTDFRMRIKEFAQSVWQHCDERKMTSDDLLALEAKLKMN